MRFCRSLCTGLLVLAAVGTAALKPTDKAQITSLFGAFRTAMLHKNAGATLKLETPDFVSVTNQGTRSGAQMAHDLTGLFHAIGPMKACDVHVLSLKIKGKNASASVVVTNVATLTAPPSHLKEARKPLTSIVKQINHTEFFMAKTATGWKFKRMQTTNTQLYMNGQKINQGG